MFLPYREKPARVGKIQNVPEIPVKRNEMLQKKRTTGTGHKRQEGRGKKYTCVRVQPRMRFSLCTGDS